MSGADSALAIANATLRVDGDVVTVTRHLRVVGPDGEPVRVGPAGAASAAIGPNVRIHVDYLRPDRLVAIEIDGPEHHVDDVDPDDPPLDPLTPEARAVVAALVGEDAADAIQEATDPSARIAFTTGPRTEAAGRFAVLTEMHERMRRPINGPWAAEAAMLLMRVDPTLADQARPYAEVAARQFSALPVRAAAEVRGALTPLVGLLGSVTALVEGHRLDALLGELRTARLEPDVFSSTDLFTGPSRAVTADREVVYRGADTTGEPIAIDVPVFLDVADDLPGVFSAAPTAKADADGVTVRVELTERGLALPPSFLNRLRVALHDARTGAVLDRVGFAVRESTAVATLQHRGRADLDADAVVVRISSEQGGGRRSSRELELTAAIHAGQLAADAERRAFATPGDDAREHAAARWRAAADLWRAARVPAQETIARENADRLSSRSMGSGEWAFETERIAPALAYALGGSIPLDRDASQLLELARLAGSVGAHDAAVTLGATAIERARDVHELDLTSDDLVGLIWAACASDARRAAEANGRPSRNTATVERAASAWSSTLED